MTKVKVQITMKAITKYFGVSSFNLFCNDGSSFSADKPFLNFASIKCLELKIITADAVDQKQPKSIHQINIVEQCGSRELKITKIFSNNTSNWQSD